jgi:formamidopyrimidine-DNA glycosylase
VPELPEVEVTRRGLTPLLVGRRVSEIETTRRSRFFMTDPRKLRRRLAGRRIEVLVRQGKYLLAVLDDGASLVLHLGMTGQLLAAGAPSPRLLRRSAPPHPGLAAEPPGAPHGFAPDQHTHLRLRFEDGGPEVLFRDVRKFGRVKLLEPGEPLERLERLGPDALEVTGSLLWDASRRRRLAVKCLLLDQAVLAGVGNIYADEALFRAGVRPARRAGRLSRKECDALADAIRLVLARGIETGGSSVDDFVQPDGSDGAFQEEHLVYQRDGEPCLRCGRELKRVVLGGRSSHYCPGCQR